MDQATQKALENIATKIDDSAKENREEIKSVKEEVLTAFSKVEEDLKKEMQLLKDSQSKDHDQTIENKTNYEHLSNDLKEHKEEQKTLGKNAFDKMRTIKTDIEKEVKEMKDDIKANSIGLTKIFAVVGASIFISGAVFTLIKLLFKG